MIKTNSTHHIALSKALIQLETDMYQDGIWPNGEPAEQDLKTVSYTHLTLPTNREV